MPIQPEECEVFIQIWVDVNEVTETGGTKGVYLVDNRISSGSENEGTTGLLTACAKSSKVCWSINQIDPNAQPVQFEISEIGNSPAWGATGQPEAVDQGKKTTFTGVVEIAGSNSYPLKINVDDVGVPLQPSVSVSD